MKTGLNYDNTYSFGWIWDYSALKGNRVMYIVTPAKPTKKQMRQVRRAVRKATK